MPSCLRSSIDQRLPRTLEEAGWGEGGCKNPPNPSRPLLSDARASRRHGKGLGPSHVHPSSLFSCEAIRLHGSFGRKKTKVRLCARVCARVRASLCPAGSSEGPQVLRGFPGWPRTLLQASAPRGPGHLPRLPAGARPLALSRDARSRGLATGCVSGPAEPQGPLHCRRWPRAPVRPRPGQGLRGVGADWRRSRCQADPSRCRAGASSPPRAPSCALRVPRRPRAPGC